MRSLLVRFGLVVAMTLAMWGLAAGSASAEGGAKCGIRGNCDVNDIDPGTPADPGSPGSSGGGEPKYPDCGDVKGGIPDGSGDVPKGWVRVRCTEGSLVLLFWVQPGAGASPETLARSLLAQIQLRPIRIGLAPKGADPLALVGMPVWLWVDAPGRTSWGPATISAGGMTLTAEVESVVWSTGDGARVSCGKGTEWTAARGGGRSPNCGHVFSKQGTYQVRATSHWVARWSGYGQSGTIPLQLSASRQLEVGEVQVIVTRGK